MSEKRIVAPERREDDAETSFRPLSFDEFDAGKVSFPAQVSVK